jgi:hypothetical protein
MGKKSCCLGAQMMKNTRIRQRTHAKSHKSIARWFPIGEERVKIVLKGTQS